MSNLLQTFEKKQIEKLTGKKRIPTFRTGDTLKVTIRITEGDKSRLQVFEGMCIARKNNSVNSNFTVRKLSHGEGVERVFPLFGPMIEKIEVVRKGDVRRAKLYYLRDRTGKSARIAEKIRKKIGIDIDVKPETVNEENLAPVTKEVEQKSEPATSLETKNEDSTKNEAQKNTSSDEINAEKKLENTPEKK